MGERALTAFDGGDRRTEGVLGGEPRLAARRIFVRQIAELVVEGGRPASEVADQLEIPRADVHRALAYYFVHPEEMAAVRERHREAKAALRAEAIDPPDTVTR